MCDLMIENRPLASFCGITVIISYYFRYFCEIPFLRGIWKISFDITEYNAFVAITGFIYAVWHDKSDWTCKVKSKHHSCHLTQSLPVSRYLSHHKTMYSLEVTYFVARKLFSNLLNFNFLIYEKIIMVPTYITEFSQELIGKKKELIEIICISGQQTFSIKGPDNNRDPLVFIAVIHHHHCRRKATMDNTWANEFGCVPRGLDLQNGL